MNSKTKRQFVVQAHDASSNHFDFRLEIDGGLESWVIPKGPSTDPDEPRLAILTERHQLEYADFEGVIPEGKDGAGPVQVWDRGEYVNLKIENGHEVAMSKCLEDGHITVELSGEKLKGGYGLIKTEQTDDWLLVKMDDDDADARKNPVSTETESVKSGKTLDEIEDSAQ